MVCTILAISLVPPSLVVLKRLLLSSAFYFLAFFFLQRCDDVWPPPLKRKREPTRTAICHWPVSVSSECIALTQNRNPSRHFRLESPETRPGCKVGRQKEEKKRRKRPRKKRTKEEGACGPRLCFFLVADQKPKRKSVGQATGCPRRLRVSLSESLQSGNPWSTAHLEGRKRGGLTQGWPPLTRQDLAGLGALHRLPQIERLWVFFYLTDPFSLVLGSLPQGEWQIQYGVDRHGVVTWEKKRNGQNKNVVMWFSCICAKLIVEKRTKRPTSGSNEKKKSKDKERGSRRNNACDEPKNINLCSSTSPASPPLWRPLVRVSLPGQFFQKGCVLASLR